MTPMQRFTPAAAAIAAVVLYAGAAVAQSAKDLVGTWQLVSNVLTAPDGKKTDQFGPDPHGVLYFADNGRYVLSIMRDGLPKFAGNGRMNGSPDENRAIVQGSISHFGTYSVADGKIVFHVDYATFPNWNGGTQNRPFKLAGDQLSFFVAAASAGGGSSEVVWKRIK